MDISTISSIVLLSLVAGMGTGLGGLIAVLRRPGKRSFGFLMGITAGVMITLSFLELVNEAWELQGWLTATLGFGAGAFFMFFIDILIPHMRFGESEFTGLDRWRKPNPVQTQRLGHFGRRRHRHAYLESRISDMQLYNSGILIAIGITIHNPEFGFFIALAILLHNIPEGVATALPLCHSGLSKMDSFKFAFLSGLAEPVGALLASLFLSAFQIFIPASLAFAGGVMVFITLDELVPTARQHGHQHYTAMGIILGAIFVFILSGLLGV
jgi:ZIP family zinc transporter